MGLFSRIPTGASHELADNYVPPLYRWVEFIHECILDFREMRYKKRLARERLRR